MSSPWQYTRNHEHFRCRGASVELQQLLDQRFAARLLELKPQSRPRPGMAGTHLSRVKGRGIDFEEFRGYQPGDDIRTIDWRVTARIGRPFVKVFREEREKPVMIAVDQSLSMGFGSRVAFKSVIAAEAAAILCWLTVDIGDRVGGVVFSDHEQQLIKPRRSKRSALRFLNILANFNRGLVDHVQDPPPVEPDYLRHALEQLYRTSRPGSNIYLISDLRGLDETCMNYLQQLAIRNNVNCVMVYDELEENLPLPGVYSITDGQHRTAIDTHSRQLRTLYHEAFNRRLAEFEERFRLMKINLIPLKTSDLVLEQLEKWKHRMH